MEMQKTVYVLRNEELGFIDDCPVFATKEEATGEAACKCRLHSVVGATLDKFEPCYPKAEERGEELPEKCKACAIYHMNF